MGRQLAIVGRLVAFSRAEARRLISGAGDKLVEHVTRSTAIVIVGGRGPQLLPSGRLPPQLARARRLIQSGSPLKVWSEEQWLESLGLADPLAGAGQRFTAGQMADALDVPRVRLHRWIAAGLLHPSEQNAGVPLFDYRQMTAARTLADLLQAGLSLAKIQRGLERLQEWLPDSVSHALAELCLSAGEQSLVVRTPEGRLAEASGQLLFEFEPEADLPALRFTAKETRAEHFRRALACEESERWDEAVAIYRQLLQADPTDAAVCFNLGNVLYASDDLPGAIDQYRQATSLEPGHANAWNNLANVLSELDRLEEATDAYRRALTVLPGTADAHFNLAQTLLELDRPAEAVLHWRAYLAFDPHSSWAEYARERLEE